MQLSPAVRVEGKGIQHEAPSTYRAYLSTITADFPARGEVNLGVKAATAKLVCMFCAMLGMYVPEERVMRYFGYDAPNEMNGLLVGKPNCTSCQLGTNDDERMLTAEQHKLRAGAPVFVGLAFISRWHR